MCHAVRLGEARRERDGRGVGRPGERSGERRGHEQRPVGAGAEAGRDLVVGLAGQRRRRPAAGVELAEAQRQGGRGEDGEQGDAAQQHGPRSTRDALGQPGPSAARAERLRAARREPVPQAAEAGGEQRHGRRARDEDRDAGRDGQAAHERHADERETGQRGDHREGGEQDGPAGRGRGRGRRVDGRLAVHEGPLEPVEAEQRVVDAYAEPDHRRERRRDRGDVEGVAEQAEPEHRDTEAGDGDAEGQQRRGDRAERHEQDHQRREQADRLGASAALLVEHLGEGVRGRRGDAPRRTRRGRRRRAAAGPAAW